MPRTPPLGPALVAATLLLVALPAAAQPTLRPGVARPTRPQVQQPAPAAPTVTESRRKRPVLTPTERLTRDFQRGDRNAAYVGVLAHALDRALSGVPPVSDLDHAVARALAAHPEVDRARLRRMVAAVQQVPVEVRARAMPRDVAMLSRAQALSMDQTQRLVAARPGATGVLRGPAPGPPPSPAPAPGELGRPGVGVSRIQSLDATVPRLMTVAASVNGMERRLVLTGSFPGTSPIVPVYVRPLDGQSLAEAGQQVVDGQRVNVVLARVNASRSRIDGALPAGLAPGRYRVSARIPQGRAEPLTNARILELAPYAYTVRITSIRALDETDPETLPTGVPGVRIPVSDEIHYSWAAFADAGSTEIGLSREYEGFDDGTERQVLVHPDDDGAVFVRQNGAAVHGIVANRLFLIVQLWEVDDMDFEMMRDGTFLADLGRASMDELDVAQFLERLSQSLYWSMAEFEGSHDALGERRLSWSAAELQQMTDNDARRHQGEMQFSDAGASYLLRYEIRRHDAPR